MDFSDFLHNTDWNKNIIMLILYASVSSVFFAFYLVPIIEEHKTSIVAYKRTDTLDVQINKSVIDLQNNFETSLKENSQIFNDLRNEIDVNAIKKYVEKYMTNVKISQSKPLSDENEIIISTMSVSGYISKSADIVDLINDFNSVRNSVRISFPLEIKAENTKQGRKQKVSFVAKIYNSKYQFDNIKPELIDKKPKDSKSIMGLPKFPDNIKLKSKPQNPTTQENQMGVESVDSKIPQAQNPQSTIKAESSVESNAESKNTAESNLESKSVESNTKSKSVAEPNTESKSVESNTESKSLESSETESKIPTNPAQNDKNEAKNTPSDNIMQHNATPQMHKIRL